MNVNNHLQTIRVNIDVSRYETATFIIQEIKNHQCILCVLNSQVDLLSVFQGNDLK